MASDPAAILSALNVPDEILEALRFVTLTTLASIVPVVMCPPSITVVVLSICGVVHVTVPPTSFLCVAIKSTG